MEYRSPPVFSLFPNLSLFDRTLRADTIEIWRLDLDLADGILSELQSSLSPDEHERAGRFVFDRDRRRFIACRGALRALLSAYSGVAREEIQFHYGVRGKPSLGSGEIQFNVSHSENVALLAFSRSGPLGIDVERVRPVPEMQSIVKTHFSATEQSAFDDVPSPLKVEAFFNGWTRKEAFIKALGDGLHLSLGSFDVSLKPDEPARLLAIQGNRDEAARWFLCHLAPKPGYVGALAAVGSERELTAWHLGWESLHR